MEEMKEYEIEKKRNWRWLIVIPIIAIAIGFYFFMNPSKIPEIPDIKTTTTTETTTETTQYMTITGTRILDEEVTGEKIIDLKAGRYNLAFQSDNDVEVSLRKNPNGFLVCCNVARPKLSGVYDFDINSGAGGDYLLKASKLTQITITQTLLF